MNPIYEMMAKKNQPNIIQQFNQFKQTFRGNPQQQVQNLLNSGKVTQQQYDEAVKRANQLKSMFGL